MGQQIAPLAHFGEGDCSRLREGLTFSAQRSVLDGSVLGNRFRPQGAGAGVQRPSGLIRRTGLGSLVESIVDRAMLGAGACERTFQQAAYLLLSGHVGASLAADETGDGGC
jgi:hypothetical protein